MWDSESENESKNEHTKKQTIKQTTESSSSNTIPADISDKFVDYLWCSLCKLRRMETIEIVFDNARADKIHTYTHTAPTTTTQPNDGATMKRAKTKRENHAPNTQSEQWKEIINTLEHVL